MKCFRCGLDFEEQLIETSHDVPKYMGGTDKEGRHNLCHNCHLEYEAEVLKVALMNLIKHSFPEDWKKECRKSAALVKGYFYKNCCGGKNDNPTA